MKNCWAPTQPGHSIYLPARKWRTKGGHLKTMKRKNIHKYKTHRCLLDTESSSKLFEEHGKLYLFTYNQDGKSRILPLKFCPICGCETKGEQKADTKEMK